VGIGRHVKLCRSMSSKSCIPCVLELISLGQKIYFYIPNEAHQLSCLSHYQASNSDASNSTHKRPPPPLPKRSSLTVTLAIISMFHHLYKHRPGKPLGAGAGDKSACEPVSLEGAGEGAPLILSLSHNSEQFVFQKPIFSL
jgi:hypothetical protein